MNNTPEKWSDLLIALPLIALHKLGKGVVVALVALVAMAAIAYAAGGWYPWSGQP